ncbi:MAG: hypothetical protein VZR53_07695 [Prevotella sp.]|nr:hypothetical protein [Prevotella sp.]
MPLVIGSFADYALEELLKVCLWIDADEPATLRKRKDEGCIFSSILTFPHADSADPYIIDVLEICEICEICESFPTDDFFISRRLRRFRRLFMHEWLDISHTENTEGTE